MSDTNSEISHHTRSEVVRLFHEDLYRRYTLTYLRSIDEIRQRDLLKGISETDIGRVKQFFAHVLYPTIDERERRDQSFGSVEVMLSNPAKLISILPSMPKLLLKYGGALRKSLDAGRKVVEAFELASEIEDELVLELLKVYRAENREFSPHTRVDRDTYQRAYTHMDQQKNRRMVELAEEQYQEQMLENADTD